ncbi:MAG: PAS domain S-box protein, partial [Desulfobacterales bacterium]
AASKMKGGGYAYFWWQKPYTGEERPKIAYAKGVPEWELFVGSGVYIDDIEQDITALQAALNAQAKTKILIFIIIVAIAFALFFILFNLLSNRLRKDLNLFVSFFDQAAFSDKKIDRETVQFVELDQMAEYANKMLTDRKQANEALIESEKRYKAVFQGAAEGILIADIETVKFKYANPAICEMLGYTEEELKRMSVGDIHPKETLQEVISEFEAQARKEKKLSMNFPCLRKDGTLIYVDIYTSPVRIDKKECNVGFFTDITERKNLEAQLLQAQKMEAVGTLAGGIAHDFNNILNVIMGYGDMVMDTLATGSPAREDMSEVLVAAARAADLTRRLLVFSKKDAVKVMPVDINEIILGLKKMLGRIIRESIEFNIELADMPLTVMADAGQIEQVLINLAVNSKDAMPEGGRLTISTGLQELNDEYVAAYGYGKPGQYAFITVADTGQGMDAETQNKIFEPFFTTKGIGEGTGLGLAISYEIIKKHRGYTNVYSEPGQGTEFKIYLPLSEEAASLEKEKEAAVPVKHGNETVLVAEDDASLRKLAAIVLESFGYSVIT